MTHEERMREMEEMDHDPMTDNPEIAKFISLAEKEAEKITEELKNSRRKWWWKIFPFMEPPNFEMGWCHRLWFEKQRILKEKYGIDWKSPRDRYPKVKFD